MIDEHTTLINKLINGFIKEMAHDDIVITTVLLMLMMGKVFRRLSSNSTKNRKIHSINQSYIICVMSLLVSHSDTIMIMQFCFLSLFFFYSHDSFMRLISLLNQIDLTVFFFSFTRRRLLETVSEWPSDKVSMTKKNSSTIILCVPLFLSK